jgi:hypothetical protein
MPIAAAAFLAVFADASTFLYTNWPDPRLHLNQACPRLIAQVAPLAVATIAAAMFPARGRAAGVGTVVSEPSAGAVLA